MLHNDNKKMAKIAERVAQRVLKAFECPKGWEKTEEGCKMKGPGGEWKYYYPEESPGQKKQEKPPEQKERAKMRVKKFEEEKGGLETKKEEKPKVLPEHEAKQKTDELLKSMWDSHDDLTVAHSAGRVLERSHEEVKNLNEKAKTKELTDEDKANIQRHRQMVDGVLSYLGKRGITKIPGMGKVPGAGASEAKRFSSVAERVAKVAFNDADALKPVKEVINKADVVDSTYEDIMKEMQTSNEDMNYPEMLTKLLEQLGQLRVEVNDAIRRLDHKLDSIT